MNSSELIKVTERDETLLTCSVLSGSALVKREEREMIPVINERLPVSYILEDGAYLYIFSQYAVKIMRCIPGKDYVALETDILPKRMISPPLLLEGRPAYIGEGGILVRRKKNYRINNNTWYDNWNSFSLKKLERGGRGAPILVIEFTEYDDRLYLICVNVVLVYETKSLRLLQCIDIPGMISSVRSIRGTSFLFWVNKAWYFDHDSMSIGAIHMKDLPGDRKMMVACLSKDNGEAHIVIADGAVLSIFSYEKSESICTKIEFQNPCTGTLPIRDVLTCGGKIAVVYENYECDIFIADDSRGLVYEQSLQAPGRLSGITSNLYAVLENGMVKRFAVNQEEEPIDIGEVFHVHRLVDSRSTTDLTLVSDCWINLTVESGLQIKEVHPVPLDEEERWMPVAAGGGKFIFDTGGRLLVRDYYGADVGLLVLHDQNYSAISIQDEYLSVLYSDRILVYKLRDTRWEKLYRIMFDTCDGKEGPASSILFAGNVLFVGMGEFVKPVIIKPVKKGNDELEKMDDDFISLFLDDDPWHIQTLRYYRQKKIKMDIKVHGMTVFKHYLALWGDNHFAVVRYRIEGKKMRIIARSNSVTLLDRITDVKICNDGEGGIILLVAVLSGMFRISVEEDQGVLVNTKIRRYYCEKNRYFKIDYTSKTIETDSWDDFISLFRVNGVNKMEQISDSIQEDIHDKMMFRFGKSGLVIV